MQRNALEGVEAFLKVAERRSFRLAASEMSVSASAISQQIRALEQRIGVPLLVRTTRSVGLTQAGEIFLRNGEPAFRQLTSAYEEARNLSEPAGMLRLHMPRGVIAMLEPLLAEFCAVYPRIDIDIRSSDQMKDLASEGFDAGIHLRETLDGDSVALRLTDPLAFIVVGGPAYLEQYGRPVEPADLKSHKCIRLATGPHVQSHWTFVDRGRTFSVPVTGRLVSDDYDLCLSAARMGLGLCLSACEMVADDLRQGRLEAFFGSIIPPSAGLFLHYPSRSHIMPKLRVFVDFVRKRFQG